LIQARISEVPLVIDTSSNYWSTSSYWYKLELLKYL